MVKFTEPDAIEPFIIDFGELPQGGAGLRFFPNELPPDSAIDPLSEGGQFLSGFITVTALNGDWTADEAGIAEISDRLSNLRSEPQPEPIFGSWESEVIEISGSNNLVFAGAENDTIDASLSESNNRIYAGSGDDTFILGAGDRAIGAEGDDSFFVTNGGNNIITGGAGTDRFWIANAQIPQSANTITDFTIGEDIIGIAGLGIAFADLNLIQNEANTLISADGNNLAILSGVETDSLSANNFVFV